MATSSAAALRRRRTARQSRVHPWLCKEDRTGLIRLHVGAAQPTHTRPETHDGQVVPDDPGPAVGGPLAVKEQQAKTESPGLGDLGMLFSWQGDTSTCNDAAASCGIRRAPKQSTCSSDPAAAQAAGAPVEGDLPRH